ncbi:MAG: AAA family ATPase [Alphaproteobacteria bacterium]|jgi:chromosome partitioning protein|nr:AAA family ATPase [Alphaproteobacteria bacterium]
MRCVVVANPKGGCGKTTLATNLAAAFAAAGLATALADVDRQRAALAWAGRRPDQAAAVRPLDWVKTVGKVPGSVERLVVDTPAALKVGQMDDLLGLADILVLPLQPSVYDQGATARFLNKLAGVKRVRKARIAVAVVANRLRPRSRANGRLDGFLGEIGHPLLARLRDSAIYGDLAADGLGLFDRPGARTAACRRDWAPLLDVVNAPPVSG